MQPSSPKIDPKVETATYGTSNGKIHPLSPVGETGFPGRAAQSRDRKRHVRTADDRGKMFRVEQDTPNGVLRHAITGINGVDVEHFGQILIHHDLTVVLSQLIIAGG